MKILAIKKYRQKFELNQKELGEMIGLTQPMISAVENGNKRLDPSRVKKISEITGISKHELRPDLFDK